LPRLDETINDLTGAVVAKRETLDDALFVLQTWIDQNAQFMTEADRETFSEKLTAEKDTQVRDGKPYGDDHSLVSSVLRLHATRLLYRLDERREGPPKSDDDSSYGRARQRLRLALRDAELALNEARVDTAIANAHQILEDTSANRRWLQDAMTRIQTVASKDVIRLAEAVPMPDLPSLNILQRLMFLVLGIKQEEIARRSLASLHKVAELQHSQLVEMVKLLADSFDASGDRLAAQQALALLAKLET
jgi:hypothetical protein